MLPEALLCDTSIPDRAVRLWARLACFTDHGEASPPIPTLARELGCSPASIDRALAALAAAGWITRETYRDDSGRQQTRTIIHVGGTGAGE